MVEIKNQKLHDAVEKFKKEGKIGAETFRRRYDNTMQELDLFARGEQWSKTDTQAGQNAWHNKPVTNFTHVIVERKTSDVAYDDITIRLYPQKADQQAHAETLEKAIQNIWKSGKFHHHVNDAVKLSRLFPYAVSKLTLLSDKIVGTDGNLVQGTIKMETIEPTNFFWDARAFEIEDAKFVFETSRVTIEDLEAHPDFDRDVIAKLKEAEASNEAGNPSAGEAFNNRDYSTGQEKTLILYEVYFKINVNSSTTQVAKMFMVNNDVLWIDENIGSLIPYSLIREFKQPHEFAGRSSAMLTLDNQKFINKVDAIVQNLATQHQNPQKAVNKSSGLDPATVAQYADAPGAVFAVDGDPSQAIVNIKPAEINPALLSLASAKKEDMMFVAMISDTQLGEAPGSVTTAGGVNSLIQQSSIKNSDSKIQFEKYITRLVELLIDIVKQHNQEIEYRVDSTNPNSEMEYEFITLKPSDYKDIQQDIVIEIPMSQTEKEQRRNQVMQLLALQGQTGQEILDPIDALSMMEFSDTNRLIANIMAKKQKQQEEEQKLKTVAQLAVQKALMAVPQMQQGASIQEVAQAAVQEAVQEFEQQQSGAQPQQGGGAVGQAAPQQMQGMQG